MKIPFVGPSATARSVNANAQRTVNCYLEFDQANPPRPVALYGLPGLLLKLTFPTSPVRGGIKFNDLYSYWVAGDTVYRVDTSYAVTSLGAIGTSTGQVGLASNGTEVLVVDGTGGWLCTGASFAAIADPDFPTGVTKATTQDSYFLVAGDGSGRFYWNETPNTGTAWNGTDFASAEGDPDNLLAILSDHREVWLIGAETGEIFINTGDADQLFQRSGNAFLQQGTAAAGTVRAMNNTIYWLGNGKDGQGIVFSAQGYNPVRVSTHAVETAIGGYGSISDALAFCFQIQGHAFYCLTFPTADATWLYDAATQQWYEWAWRDPATNELHRHRANCCVFFNGKQLVGDWETGKVYSLELDTYTDNTDPILRLRSTQALHDASVELSVDRLRIDMETGVGLATGQGSDPQLMFRFSKDGGRSWSSYDQASIGAAGEYGKRVLFGPLGTGDDWVFEISMTDPVKFAVFGADADVTQGL